MYVPLKLNMMPDDYTRRLPDNYGKEFWENNNATKEYLDSVSRNIVEPADRHISRMKQTIHMGNRYFESFGKFLPEDFNPKDETLLEKLRDIAGYVGIAERAIGIVDGEIETNVWPNLKEQIIFSNMKAYLQHVYSAVSSAGQLRVPEDLEYPVGNQFFGGMQGIRYVNLLKKLGPGLKFVHELDKGEYDLDLSKDVPNRSFLKTDPKAEPNFIKGFFYLFRPLEEILSTPLSTHQESTLEKGLRKIGKKDPDINEIVWAIDLMKYNYENIEEKMSIFA